YSLYQTGDAPMMVSYSTDTTAGGYFAGSDPSPVLTPQGQTHQQIEAVRIVPGTDVPERAHRFVNYVLTDEVQSLIPTSNWMFPVNAEAALPDFFEEYAVIPENPVQLDLRLIEENEQRWLREWARLMTGLR